MMIRFLHSLAAVSMLVALSACEEDIVLVAGTDQPFTLYGLLTPTTDTQYVHVFPIEGTLNVGAGLELDARFTSVDLETGEERTWADSVVQDARGAYGHVFWSPFRAAYGHRYLITASRPDEQSSHVEVEIPAELIARAGENRMGPPAISEMRLIGASPHLLKVEVNFLGRAISGFQPSGAPIYTTHTLKVAYEERVAERSGELIVPVDLNNAHASLMTEFGKRVNANLLNQNGIDLLLVTLDVIVANDEWAPPGGRLDSLSLAHPAVMRNVQNGYGFVGAGYPIIQSWRPHFELREAAGFVAHV